MSMSSISSVRLAQKRQARPPDVPENVLDWENHLVLRVPDDCVDRMNRIVNEEPKSEELGIIMNHDTRHAQVKLGNTLLSGKVLDLPCINEVYKTLDKKNVYKVADISQILVLSHDAYNPTQSQPSTSTASDPNVDPIAEAAKVAKKEARQWQYPHGLTPPMKSARRKRFRKTKKKKFMDAPEVEKELKRLLRADLDAESVRWEIVEDNKKLKDEQSDLPTTETALFGDTLSSSEQESDGDDKDD